MKRALAVIVTFAVVVGLGGVALAWGPGGPGMMRGAGMMGGPGMMGGRGMGPGMMGPRWAATAGAPGSEGDGDQWGCRGMMGARDAAVSPITEDKAKELATEYAGKYLPGFSVERVLPFTGRFHTMYQVELKGAGGELRTLHVNPWGAVRPFGGPRSS
jgi:hypothetical protein